MKDKLKKYWPFALLGVWALVSGYMSYYSYNHPNPAWEEIRRTPISWIDVFFGFAFGALFMFAALFIPVVLPFKKRGGSDPDGDGSDPSRRINLPMLGKVVSIEDLKKMPPKGPVQLAPTGS